MDFKVSNALTNEEKLLLRIPRDSVDRMESSETIKYKLKIDSQEYENALSTQNFTMDTEFLEITINLPRGIDVGDRTTIEVQNFKNRLYSGSATSKFGLTSLRIGLVPIDHSEPFLEAPFVPAKIEINQALFPPFSGAVGEVTESSF